MTNKNILVSSLKRSESIKQKESGLDCTVSNNKFCPMTLKALTMKPERQHTAVLSSEMAVNLKTDKNPNWIRIAKTCLEYIGLNLDNSDFSERNHTVILSLKPNFDINKQ